MEVFIYIYLFIGFIYAIYDWFNYQLPMYKKYLNNTNSYENLDIDYGTTIIFYIMVILFWPLFIILQAIGKIFKNS